MHRSPIPQSPPPPSSSGDGTGLGFDGGLDAAVAAPPPPPPAKDFSYLLRPEIYHPLTLANVPPPFRTSQWQPNPATPLPDLVAAGHFRAAAIVAAQQLTGTGGDGVPGLVGTPPDPTDHVRIFDLLYTRLVCLLLIDATALAAQEGKALGDLNNPFYLLDDAGTVAATGIANHLVPWALRVLHVRLQGLGFGDPRRAVMSYYELAREARARIGAALARHDHAASELWKGRLAELGLKVAGALIEMDDMAGAAAHLASMSAAATGGDSSTRTETAKALLWLHLGDVEAARAAIHAAYVGRGGFRGDDLAPRVVAALCDMADDEYEAALSAWRALREDAPGDEMIGVNLAVCLLYVGKLEEGRALLESLVDAGYSSHTLLFNLSTMYELCTDRAKSQKQQLAQRVADMEPSAKGWEKANADFKL
ncbi:Tetratricopeptide-like helical [Niveomyces insectorum RCEF 264]|uniref:Tetratricopeptide-like helical n=1 Tax=Niveomyces insectorum RCEF 264 TaxID=1081102 RepID=A0A162K2R2_9HYPO|nr:Tetratricopeptide-like helical [Niveomyces insectorum RCEF 264]